MIKIYKLWISKLILEDEICIRIREHDIKKVYLDFIILNCIGKGSGFLYDTQFSVFCLEENIDKMCEVLKKSYLQEQMKQKKALENMLSANITIEKYKATEEKTEELLKDLTNENTKEK